MPPQMKIHSPPPTKQPIFKQPPAYVRPEPDKEAELAAAKANELLNLRSRGISSIIKQREEAGSQYAAHSAIKLPPADPRTEELHKELGIDKVVTVKCPFEIDTTPGGFYKTQGAQAVTQDVSNGGKGKLRDMWMPGARESATPPPRPDALEYSANGTTAPAYVDGRLLRGGWAAY
jgi:hypothetical protein